MGELLAQGQFPFHCRVGLHIEEVDQYSPQIYAEAVSKLYRELALSSHYIVLNDSIGFTESPDQ
jgi:hypothetical protein